MEVGLLPTTDELVALYLSVGWTAYTDDPARLARAVAASGFVATLWQAGQLIGLCRAITDGEVICYVQDILVDPAHHRHGLGRRLLQACLDAHPLRQVVLLTDDRPQQRAFYRSMGFTDTRDEALHAFVRLGS